MNLSPVKTTLTRHGRIPTFVRSQLAVRSTRWNACLDGSALLKFKTNKVWALTPAVNASLSRALSPWRSGADAVVGMSPPCVAPGAHACAISSQAQCLPLFIHCMHAVPACTEWQHPYVNVFKLCDVDQLKEVVVHGDVKEHMVRCMDGRACMHACVRLWPCAMGVPGACMPR